MLMSGIISLLGNRRAYFWGGGVGLLGGGL